MDDIIAAVLACGTILALVGVVARQHQVIGLLREQLQAERERRERGSRLAARWARHPQSGTKVLRRDDCTEPGRWA